MKKILITEKQTKELIKNEINRKPEHSAKTDLKKTLSNSQSRKVDKNVFELIGPEEIPLLKPKKNTQYVFNDDFRIPIKNASTNEKILAEKYLRLLEMNSKKCDEINFSIHPVDLCNLFVLVQRELKL